MLTRFLPALLLVAACGTATSYIKTADSADDLEPRDPSSVDVYADQQPTRPYVEVGIIEGHRRTRWSRAETLDIYDAIRDDAARQGCDAVIITGSHDTAVNRHVSLEGYLAQCVMYTEAPVASAATARPSAGEGP